MSSLLNTASPWTNANAPGAAKKRIPKMKLPKLNESFTENTETTPTYPYQSLQDNLSLYNNSYISNIPSASPNNPNYEIRNEKHEEINKILEKMTIESDGSGLQDYKNDTPPPMWKMKLENTWKQPSSPPLPPTTYNFPSKPNWSSSSPMLPPGESIHPMEPDDSTSAVYKYAYETPGNIAKISKGMTENSFEENITYKLQYLTHLTEQMSMDKTSNITEEFILYIMVGIFMIYIVDSFTRIRS